MSAPPEIATDIIRKRTWSVCDLLQKVTADNIAKNNVDYIQGAARLEDGGVVVTSDDGRKHAIRAKAILIATGSRPFHPPNISFDMPGVCDTDTILYRGRVPEDILIVGGGPGGVEFSTICHALGARVTLIDRGTRLMSMMDGELTSHMEDLFRNWEIRILFGSVVESVAAKGNRLEVKLSTGETLFPDTVLFAAGRVANVEGLVGASWSTQTSEHRWMASTRLAMCSVQLSPRSLWSKDEWLSVTHLGSRSKAPSIRAPSRQCMGCRKSREQD
jgi:NAD(P) transhydrogenase